MYEKSTFGIVLQFVCEVAFGVFNKSERDNLILWAFTTSDPQGEALNKHTIIYQLSVIPRAFFSRVFSLSHDMT